MGWVVNLLVLSTECEILSQQKMVGLCILQAVHLRFGLINDLVDCQFTIVRNSHR